MLFFLTGYANCSGSFQQIFNYPFSLVRVGVRLGLGLWSVVLASGLELEFYLFNRHLHNIGEIISKCEIILSGDSHKGTNWPLT